MNLDFEIFKGKTFSNLCKDIVKNSENKRNQLNVLISDLKDLVKNVNDAILIVPLLKDYYDVGVKNDGQLIQLANVVQRLASKAESAKEGNDLMLTDEEKRDLFKEIDNVVINSMTKSEKSDTDE